MVEKMYFRGYLLPRISRLGAWAPLVNTVLFSPYHLFTPWLNVGRIAIDRRTRRRHVYTGSAVVLVKRSHVVQDHQVEPRHRRASTGLDKILSLSDHLKVRSPT